MSYEEIAEMNRRTEELTRNMMLKWNIIDIVLLLMLAALIVMAARIMWEDHKERKARTSSDPFWATFPTGEGYVPTVTDDIQVSDGVTFHRMGVPDRR